MTIPEHLQTFRHGGLACPRSTFLDYLAFIRVHVPREEQSAAAWRMALWCSAANAECTQRYFDATFATAADFWRAEAQAWDMLWSYACGMSDTLQATLPECAAC